MNRFLAFASIASAAFTAAAAAQVTTITFDELAPPVSVTEQYAQLGAHFSSTGAFDTNNIFHNSVEVFAFGFAGYGTNAAGMWSNVVTIAFDADVSNFSVLMADTESGTFLGSVRALDANGAQIGFISAMTGGYNTPAFHQQTLALNIGGIRSVQLLTDRDGAVFDNVTYTRVPTPGPAAAGLFAIGLGLARRRR